MTDDVQRLRRAREHSALRRAGYRILPGEMFSYILHLRPREWPIMAAHTALGFFLAAGFRPHQSGSSWDALAWGLLLWVGCLNAGTLALNSAFDDDDDDIGYLNAPPPPPPYLAHVSVALLAAGLALSLTLPAAFTAVYALCFAISILYSVPPFRFKAVAGMDWIINMFGFGTFTPFAGWAITGRPLELWAALVLIAFCPLFAALYPLTQLYQMHEDRSRGDRTLALAIGLRASLLVAIAGTLIAFLFFAAAALAGPASRFWPLIAVAFTAWMAALLPWYRHREHRSPAEHQRGMYHALKAWALTDAAVLLTFAV
ncbi:MAG: UbiA prenyltransferase family protein [Gemmatimonadetes bacterium]|nr:UbiA prenyltransferase family protein [Gemmatimonadota bacterium]